MTDDELLKVWTLWDQRPKDERRARAYVDGCGRWARERGTVGHQVHRKLTNCRREGMTHTESVEYVSRTL